MDFLVVSHGGFIMEFVNSFKALMDPKYVDQFKNNTKNTSITIFKITETTPGKLDFKITLQNDNTHLAQSVQQLNAKHKRNPVKMLKKGQIQAKG